MTEAQAAWLRKLRDEGPQEHQKLQFFGITNRTGWVESIGLGWRRRRITPAGLAALAEHDAARGQ